MTTPLVEAQATRPDPDTGVRTTRTRRFTRHRAFLPALVGMFGLTISLIANTVPSLWYDEAATVSMSTRPWHELFAATANVDAVHLVYYSVMHVIFDVVGYSPFTLRAPSAVAVGVAAALIVVLGRQFGRARLGVIAAVVFVLLPRTMWAASEGRSYAITAAPAILLTILLVRVARNPSRVTLAAYASVMVVSCTVFIYLFLIVIAHAVAMAWWFAAARGFARRPAGRWAAVATLTTLVLAPFALIVSRQSGQVSWLPRIDADTVRDVVAGQWFFMSDAWAIVGWVGIVIGAALLLRRGYGLSLGRMIVPLVVVPTTLLILVSVVYTPLYNPRYLSMCLPFVAIAIGAALDALPARLPAALSLVLLAGLAVPVFIDQHQPDAKEYSITWAEAFG